MLSWKRERYVSAIIVVLGDLSVLPAVAVIYLFITTVNYLSRSITSVS